MSDSKSAQAVITAGILTDIILERNLIGAIPRNRQIPLENIKKLTCGKLSNIHKYVSIDLFTVHKTTLEVTDNDKLLSEKTLEYCRQAIKKFVCPSKHEQDEYIYNVGILYNETYYTAEEKSFIDLIFNNFMQIAKLDLNCKISSIKDLKYFNEVNNNFFYLAAKKVYNAILHKKLHAGDSIIPYINKVYINDQLQKILSEKLKMCSIYDYFFDENAVLKCDLDTNLNMLIKNFINSVLYNFTDYSTKIILLNKLKMKYPLLIKDKNFYDFD